MVNIFPFIGAAIFQVLIGMLLSGSAGGLKAYSAEGFRYMFLICLVGSVISLGAAFFLRETLSPIPDSSPV